MTVGFIGLGAMGAAMVRNLLAKGETVIVWNRSRAIVDDLVAEGAVPATTVDDVFAADIVLSMLAHDQAMREVLIDSGALGRAPKGVTHVNLATISTASVCGFSGRRIHLRREKSTPPVSSPMGGMIT